MSIAVEIARILLEAEVDRIREKKAAALTGQDETATAQNAGTAEAGAAQSGYHAAGDSQKERRQ